MSAAPPTPPAPSSTPLRLLRWAPLCALVAAAAATARYAMQGTGNVYTNASQTFWLERDALVGATRLPETYVWLGLDAIGAIVAVGIGAAVAWWLARRYARRAGEGRAGPTLAMGMLVAAMLGGVLCVASLAVPTVAFASGAPPEGAATTFAAVDRGARAAAGDGATSTSDDDRAPTLAVPAGRWRVADHDLNHVIARLAAGGETFEGTFGPLSGEITLTPDDLARTIGRVEVPADSIDTGIPLRSQHAREDLQVATHPHLAVELDGLREVSAVEGGVAFVADASVAIMGRTLTRPIEGTVRALDAEARSQYSVDVPAALLVSADISVPLRDIPLDRDTFDQDAIGVHVRAVLVPAASRP